MSRSADTGPGFWRTLWLLLETARLRSRGRRRRQRELFRTRARRSQSDWGRVGSAVLVMGMALVHVGMVALLCTTVLAAERQEDERNGVMMVSSAFLRVVHHSSVDDPSVRRSPEAVSRVLGWQVAAEAHRIADETGRAATGVRDELVQSIARAGSAGLVAQPRRRDVLRTLPADHRLPALLGTFVLVWWSLILIFQGEGLELDVQRRRNPMWEWLFSHPVPAAAVFLAELLAPLAANPLCYSAPLFPAIVYGLVYGPLQGVLALLVVGVPLTVAAACMGKALEAAVMLRCTQRTRGAILGIMSWFGSTGLIVLFVGLNEGAGRLVPWVATELWGLGALPWPYLDLFLGRLPDGSWSMPRGVLTCELGAALTVAGSVAFTVWAARRGLAGPTARPTAGKIDKGREGAGFGRWALYRKELLWLRRDRSAIVQIVLIPLSFAGYQLFQLGNVTVHVEAGWSTVCGAGVLFGTLFLSYLGPRSLSSEGQALWIALTWPQGLEALLKAKARLWAALASIVVGATFAIAAYLYPRAIWQIVLLIPAWLVFAYSMSQKASTLATIASESGEPERVPVGRRWATMLGTMTFAIGVLSGQWNVVITGVVYSILTAAAMWQAFRARLPFLYDRWSEQLPTPPTLVHAMVAVSVLVDIGAAVALAIALFAGRDAMAAVYAIGYTAAAAAVAVGMEVFLADRGVALTEVFVWPHGRAARLWSRLRAVALGVLLGVVLGALALLYLFILHQIPGLAEVIIKSEQQQAAIPHLREAYAAMAVLVAPFAEEFLFRGLLYRALDREWGGWRAVAGSAAFFAIYHPVLSWVPVCTVGALNAWLFKRTGRLAPAIALHMIYNAVVVGATLM